MLTSVCGMRLTTYGVGLGWIGVIFSFLAVILTSIALGNVDEIAQEMVKAQNTNLTEDQMRTVLVIILSIYLALQLINLLSSGMLIVGTLKERHLYLLPWLFNNGVALIFGLITQIGMFVQASSSSVVPSILISLLTFALSVYLYYGIYSLYKQLQRTSDLQRPLIPPQSSARNYEGLPNNP
ncbi:uncharacterized protein [Drosophila kikkawai]|uniref:Uncharacterized protein n=1 Tax=Drosophila kikkawai TaxID=30033 RepID=A0A6P4JCC8_DROKI|nr:uncharacterized protein LOC108082366 [Drosophila kikkawai]